MSMPGPAAPAAPTSTEQGQQESVVPTPPATPGQPAAPAAPEQNQGTTTLDAAGIAALQAENARLQREANDARVRAKGAVADQAKRDQLLAFAQAIGIDIPKGDDNSVEALQAKLQQEVEGRQTDQGALSTERQTTAIELAAFRHGIPEDKQGYLNFLLKGNPEFTKLDSASPDYKTSVAKMVADLKAADPFFAAAPGGAARSGAEQFGGAGQPGEVTQDAFNAMGVMERTAVFQKNPELYQRLVAGSSS